MTNEEKAKEIANKAPFLSNVTPNIQAHAYNAALEMAEWKDKEWADRFKKAFEGLWTASFNVDNLSSKIETTIEFKHIERVEL